VSPSINTGIDIPLINILDNYDKVRGRISSSKIQYSGALSLSSTKSSVAYHKRMELNNAMTEDVKMEDDSSQLSYETSQENTI